MGTSGLKLKKKMQRLSKAQKKKQVEQGGDENHSKRKTPLWGEDIVHAYMKIQGSVTGVGLSVERKYINQLPKVNTKIQLHSKKFEAVPRAERTEHTQLVVLDNTAIELIIGDSKAGWAEAIKFYFDIITSKQYDDIKYIFINYNNVRPAGERLKTFGGFASGHTAIQQMFEKMNALFQRRGNGQQWYKIRPLDALDIATIIAENVVAGGTRRSAEIVFCDPDETEVLEAKSNLYINQNGNWIPNNEVIHRSLSNNTVFYQERPTKEVIDAQFETMRYSGEPKLSWALQQ